MPSAHDIATALRQRQPGMPVKKLHKLLYYCQGHHLAVHGKPLFDETIEAWDMGPVVAELWRDEKYGAPTPPTGHLGEAELNTIGYTLSRYGNLTGRDLENLSHNEDPWLIANRGRPPGGHTPIDPDVITGYFRDAGREEGGGVCSETVAAWLAKTATVPAGPGRPLTREELAAEFEASEARLGG
ncbi:MAG: Panacea domain-containing protein [Pseudonocardiaceae bacterium]